MSFKDIENLSKDELEKKTTKINKLVKKVSSSDMNKCKSIVDKFMGSISSIKLSDILKNPSSFISSLLDLLGWDKTDLVNFITLLGGVSAAISISSKVKEYSKGYSTSNSASRLYECIILSSICSIYMTFIEVYVVKNDRTQSLADEFIKWIKNKYAMIKELWKVFKRNWMRPLKVIEECVIRSLRTSIDYWKWQLKLGEQDPTHTYKTVFILNWIFNLGVLYFGAVSSLEYFTKDTD